MSLTSSNLEPETPLFQSEPCQFRFFGYPCSERRVLEEQRQMRETTNSVHDRIHLLPVEITSHVFGYCLTPMPHFEGHNDIRHHSRVHRKDATVQLELGAVCRRWRQILWSNPSFWRCVSVILSDNTPIIIPSLVQEWLSRSAHLSLAICLEYEHVPGPESEEEVEAELSSTGLELLKVIQGVADRWSLVSLILPSSYIQKLCINTPQPQLLLLYLRTTDFDPSTCLDFGGVSGPQHLEVFGVALENLHIEWNAVTHFHQGGFGIMECLEAFGRFQHLTWVELTNIDGLDLPVSPVTNPSIQYLGLEETSAQLWQSISLPALQELHLDGDFKSSTSASEFVHRSQCRLKIACFVWPERGDDLISFLKSSPSLEQLYLIWSESKVEETLLKHLAETETTIGEREFLPSLSRLDFDSSRDFTWSLMASIASVKSSQPDVIRRPLHTISMKISNYVKWGFSSCDNRRDLGIDAESLREILELIDTGINVELRDYDDQDIVKAWIKHYKTVGGDYEWLKMYQPGNRSFVE